MIMNTVLYATVLTFNCAVLSATIISPMKEDGLLRLFDPRQGAFDYGMKRSDPPQEPDSKERRTRMGSVIIRYGRSQMDRNTDNLAGYALGNGEERKIMRSSRGASPILRFGRSSMKGPQKSDKLMGREETGVIRFGRNLGAASDLDLSVICSNLILEEDPRNNKNLQLYLSKLMYICNSDGDDESLQRSNDLPDDNVDTV